MTTVTYKTLKDDKKPKNKGCCCARLPWYGKAGLGAAGVLFAGIIIAVIVYSSFGPLHASCKVTWTVSAPCSEVRDKILQQMKTWSGKDNCKNGGEKCLYSVTSSDNSSINGVHETPVKHYKDDLSFKFNAQEGGCQIKGYSTSETWYAVLDYGTNYCNLHNLITGAKINETKGYKEETQSSQCTQYSSANCNKY